VLGRPHLARRRAAQYALRHGTARVMSTVVGWYVRPVSTP
jgi:hypothetical protein